LELYFDVVELLNLRCSKWAEYVECMLETLNACRSFTNLQGKGSHTGYIEVVCEG